MKTLQDMFGSEDEEHKNNDQVELDMDILGLLDNRSVQAPAATRNSTAELDDLLSALETSENEPVTSPPSSTVDVLMLLDLTSAPKQNNSVNLLDLL